MHSPPCLQCTPSVTPLPKPSGSKGRCDPLLFAMATNARELNDTPSTLAIICIPSLERKFFPEFITHLGLLLISFYVILWVDGWAIGGFVWGWVGGMGGVGVRVWVCVGVWVGCGRVSMTARFSNWLTKEWLLVELICLMSLSLRLAPIFTFHSPRLPRPTAPRRTAPRPPYTRRRRSLTPLPSPQQMYWAEGAPPLFCEEESCTLRIIFRSQTYLLS